jgi:ankyrin repeat protein
MHLIVRNKSTEMSHECSRSSDCGTHASSSVYHQTLEELEFERSIYNACVYGDLGRVKSLVEKQGARIVNEQDKSGYSALHYAARNNHLNICQYLISNGAQLNLKTHSCQSTPLHRAAYMGHSSIVKYLLEMGADPFIVDYENKMPIQKCVDQLVANLNNTKSLLSEQAAISNANESNSRSSSKNISSRTSDNNHFETLIIFAEKHPTLLDQIDQQQKKEILNRFPGLLPSTK